MNAVELRHRLEEMGFQIKQFTPYHMRINERLDIFPSARAMHGCAWNDIRTGARGRTETKDFPTFIQRYLATHVIVAPQRPRIDPLIVDRGWWNCPLEGCKYKLRDDGTSEAARRQSAHMDEHQGTED